MTAVSRKPSAGRKVVTGKARRVSAAAGASVPADDAAEVTLTDKAYAQLEELITTLALPPGMVLGEQSLVQRLGIGRTPIREALQRLARDGLVVVMPRRGILVSEINVRSQLRLLETRRVLERLVARLAAERATRTERDEFSALARDMRKAAAASNDLRFMRLDGQFNKCLIEAARNEYVDRSLASLSGLSRRFWYQHYKQAADLPLAANLHADVCEAVAKGDVAAAEAASDRLIDYIENFARKTLDV